MYFLARQCFVALLAGLIWLAPGMWTSRAATGPLETLTSAQQVISLGIEGARLNPHPIRLQAVVTYLIDLHRGGRAARVFVQDETAGLYVSYENTDIALATGDRVEVTGVAASGAFHTYVKSATIRVLGRADLPAPKRVSPPALNAGADFAQWARLKCAVRDIAQYGEHLVLQVQTESHPYHIWLRVPAGFVFPGEWMDAELEADGVVWTLTDRSNRPYGFRLHVPGVDYLRVLTPGSTNIFNKLPATSLGVRHLARMDDRRRLFRGVVTRFSPEDQMIQIRDETGPLNVHLLQPIVKDRIQFHGFTNLAAVMAFERVAPPDPMPGDVIELVATVETQEPFAPVLHGGEFRILRHDPAPAPRFIHGGDGLLPQNDCELVRLRARFVDREIIGSGRAAEVKLWLQSDGLMFEARLPVSRAGDLTLEDDSYVEVTGICMTVAGESRRPRGMRLYLRDADDLRLLREAAPVISATAFRILVGAGVTIALVLAWVGMLRRQVSRNTAELRESKSRYEALIEGTSVPVVAHESDGTIAFVNRAALRLFGLEERETWVGKPFPENLSAAHQADGRTAEEVLRQHRKEAINHGTAQFEWVARTTSGAEIRLEVVLTPIHLNGRRVFQSVLRDITQRARSERVQRATFDISEAAHAADDLDALYARIHEIVRGLMPARNFYLLIHDPAKDHHFYAYHVDEMDEKPMPRKISRGLNGYVLRAGKALLADRESMSNPANEWCMVSGTPSAIWLGVPLVVRGRSIGVMAVQDYHDPKAYGEEEKQILAYVATQTALAIDRKRAEVALAESENRTRLVVDTALDAVITMDANGVIRGWNAQAVRTFGWTAEDAIGRPLADTIITPTAREAHAQGLKRFITTGEGPVLNKRIEVTALNRDGREFPIELSIAPLRVGSTWIFSGFARDITDRKRAESELLRNLERERELGELKTNFVSLVSHEFRTPLGVIMSATEVLQRYFDRLPADKRARHLDMIFRSTKNLATLIEEVLVIGKVEEGRMDFVPAPLELAQVCRTLADEVSSATGAACPIQLDVRGDLGGAVGDEGLIRHILTNLLSNAVKYSEPGSPVSLTIERRDSWAALEVRDSGIGIPLEDQPRIFSSFMRGKNVGQRPGTGLGLVIVQRCVQLHGGRVVFESAPGKGTTFAVLLPLYDLSLRHEVSAVSPTSNTSAST